MRVAVIGGTGHIGTYLVPSLVEAGHDVVCVTSGKRDPYQAHPAWARAQQVVMDRKQAEAEGRFGERIVGLGPEAVVDIISFDVNSTRGLVEAIEGRIKHFVHVSTAWVYGRPVEVPVSEDAELDAFDDYGILKAQIDKYLLAKARSDKLPVTIVRPGHVVGCGWEPVNPAGNLNVDVFRRLLTGQELTLPDSGMQMLHHVHSKDLAQVIVKALTHRDRSVGECFNVASPRALTLRGYAEKVAERFGKKANLRFMPWEEWKTTVSEEDAHVTWRHIAHHTCCSIEKARTLLGYEPSYTSLEAICESVRWLMANTMAKT